MSNSAILWKYLRVFSYILPVPSDGIHVNTVRIVGMQHKAVLSFGPGHSAPIRSI